MEVKVEIKKVLVKDLKYAPYNPRKISDEMLNKLKQSIEEFGYVEPIVVNKRTRHVVGGNQRLKALEDLRIEEVEAVFVDLDDAREKALNVALNKITGEWDYPKLKDLLEELDTGAGDIELTGFDMVEIEQLMTEISFPEVNENKLPPVEERATPGDIWQLGNHRIACGDCTDIELMEKLLEGQKVNVIVTSPPYAQQRKDEYGGIPAEEYGDWFGKVAEVMGTILDEGGSFFLNIKEHVDEGQRNLYVKKLVIKMVEEYGWRFIDELVWIKPGLPGGWKNRLRNEFEPVFWFAKDGVDVMEREIEEGKSDEEEEILVDEYGSVFHFSKQEKIKFYPKSGGRISKSVLKSTPFNKSKSRTGNIGVSGPKVKSIARPGNVLRITGNNESWEHPAMFPVKVPEFFIKLTTRRGERVLDPFLGSGSTLMAAEKMKRVCLGIDLQPKYIDIVLTRWEELTGQKAVKVNG
jgi:DNA modification methylase/mRNA-degrading endonuclease RelE of RelBE toxin-antitoxin system